MGPWLWCRRRGRTRRIRGRTGASRRATSAADLNQCSRWNRARVQVRGDLALHALERIVDRFGVAIQAAGDLLVGAAVQVERPNRALEIRERAGEAADEAVQLLRGDDLD